MADAPDQEAPPDNKKKIGQDTPENAGLRNMGCAVLDGCNAYLEAGEHRAKSDRNLAFTMSYIQLTMEHCLELHARIHRPKGLACTTACGACED